MFYSNITLLTLVLSIKIFFCFTLRTFLIRWSSTFLTWLVTRFTFMSNRVSIFIILTNWITFFTFIYFFESSFTNTFMSFVLALFNSIIFLFTWSTIRFVRTSTWFTCFVTWETVFISSRSVIWVFKVTYMTCNFLWSCW